MDETISMEENICRKCGASESCHVLYLRGEDGATIEEPICPGQLEDIDTFQGEGESELMGSS